MGEVERTWKVGELARATGLTIRALRHYDHIGLLVPGRTESGHRVYSRADVERIYRVLALRGVGMSLDEIKVILDDDMSLMDTVRRHIAAVERDIEQRRRLLARLHDMFDALQRSSAPTVEDLIGAVEAMTVVEATIADILTRERWDAAWELQQPYVILLRETDGERLLPIYIGEPEVRALIMQRGERTPRPMGHDLMAALLDAVDARVERVVIERLRDNTFFATVAVISGNGAYEVDARPSDALNLAVRAGAPIQIATDVIDAVGVTTWHEPGTTLGGGGPPAWTPVSERSERWRMPTYTIDEHSPSILRLAAAEARMLDHSFVAAQHLLLGVLADANSSAARLLHQRGITIVTAREAVMAQLGDTADGQAPDNARRLTPRAIVSIHRAGVESRRRSDTVEITPMHLLLALVDSPDAADVLGLDATDVASVRDDVRNELDDSV